MKGNASKNCYRCRFEHYNLEFLFAKVKTRILDIQVNVSAR